ncbi:hypothetical protein V6N13_015052 [Hibiscus sabdariffa]
MASPKEQSRKDIIPATIVIAENETMITLSELNPVHTFPFPRRQHHLGPPVNNDTVMGRDEEDSPLPNCESSKRPRVQHSSPNVSLQEDLDGACSTLSAGLDIQASHFQ